MSLFYNDQLGSVPGNSNGSFKGQYVLLLSVWRANERGKRGVMLQRVDAERGVRFGLPSARERAGPVFRYQFSVPMCDWNGEHKHQR